MNKQVRCEPHLQSASSHRLFTMRLFLITVITAESLVAQTGQNAVIKDTSKKYYELPEFF